MTGLPALCYKAPSPERRCHGIVEPARHADRLLDDRSAPLTGPDATAAGCRNRLCKHHTRTSCTSGGETAGVEGIASYYAKSYNGKRTNSGHRYDPAELTAAHPTLPHGTRVRVINLANDKEVTVTINDRCRSRKQPFIDLSRAAAKQLGFLGKGITRVRIIPLDEESG